jgi:hypothetical protein
MVLRRTKFDGDKVSCVFVNWLRSCVPAFQVLLVLIASADTYSVLNFTYLSVTR